MKKLLTTAALFLAMATSSAISQESRGEAAPTSGPIPNKPLDQYTAEDVLRLVRVSYTMYNRDFTGVLRASASNKLLGKKIPFILSLKPDSIRFIFDDPSQVILVDTRNKNFALYEGTNGQQPAAVNPSKYGQSVRDTDATYDDLSMRFLYWPNARIVKNDRIKNRDAWLVRVLNPDGRGDYATVDVWIDKGSGGMLKMIGYNRSGRPIRRFEVLSGKKFGDIWMIDEMRIETISPSAGGQVKSSTRMSIKATVN